MKNLFVPYDIAVLAKEKGFNEPCLTHYYNADSSINGNLSTEFSTQMDNYNNTEKGYTYTVSAPIYQQLTDWLREDHKIHIEIWLNSYTYNWEATLYKLNAMPIENLSDEFNPYDQEKTNKINTDLIMHPEYYQLFNFALKEALDLIL